MKCSFDNFEVKLQLPFNPEAAFNVVVKELSPAGSLMQDTSAQQSNGNAFLQYQLIMFLIIIHILKLDNI